MQYHQNIAPAKWSHSVCALVGIEHMKVSDSDTLRPPLSEDGFTAVELLVTVAITAIIAAVGITQIPALSKPFDRLTARSYFIQDLKQAQAEAIKWGCRGIFSIGASGQNYSFGCDFLPTDTASPPSADQIFFQRNLPSSITVAADAPVIFSSRGQAVDAEGDFNNVLIQLLDSSSGSPEAYAEGLLLGTGEFSFE